MMSRQDPSGRSSDALRRPLPGLALALCLWALPSCGPAPSAPAEESVAADPLPTSFAWVGTWVGNGAGLLGGEERHWSDAVLHVTLDRVEIRRADCPYCLTLTLEDSLFVMNHIDPMSEVELDLSVHGSSETRLLSLRKYSADGGTGNFVDVRFRVRDPNGVLGHASFQLQRQ